MNYEEMSDFEINLMVACTIDGVSVSDEGRPNYAIDCFLPSGDNSSAVKWAPSGDDEWAYFNPCNNPSDAWPTMDEYKIGLAFVNGEWRASSVIAGYHEFSDNNPFRSAMIVYLMMQEEKQ